MILKFLTVITKGEKTKSGTDHHNKKGSKIENGSSSERNKSVKLQRDDDNDSKRFKPITSSSATNEAESYTKSSLSESKLHVAEVVFLSATKHNSIERRSD